MMKEKHSIYLELLPYVEKFSRMRILVVGDIMQDIFIWGQVRRISPEAPVPVVRVERESAMPGGAANVVHNLASLGVKVSLAGVIGRDQSGDRLLSDLKRMSVDCRAVLREPGRPTSVKTRIIAHSQQVVRFDREVLFPLRPASERKILASMDKLIPRMHGIIISDYAKGFITPNLARKVIALVRKYRKPLMVDPKLVNLHLFRRASVITPNHYEAAEATGIEPDSDPEVRKAGKRLLKELDCQAVLITQGEAGMTLIERKKPARHIPAQAREVFDVTGAGDTVISAFSIGVASGMSFYLAACLANIAAGIAVGKLGTSVVSGRELKDALENQGL